MGVAVGRRAVLRGCGAFASAAPFLAAGSRAAGAPAAASKLPVEAFAAKPSMEDLALSPDGTRVLARVQVDGAEMLGVYTLATGKLVTFALPQGSDLGTFQWAGNDRFLTYVLVRFDAVDSNGLSLVHGWGRMQKLICFDVKSQAARIIEVKDAVTDGQTLIFVHPAGEFVVVSASKTLFSEPFVYRISLADGRETLIERLMPNAWNWYTDETGAVRAAVGFHDEKWFVAYRPGASGAFRIDNAGRSGIFDRAPVAAMTFVSGSDKGYILSNKEGGRYAVYDYDFGTRTLGRTVFACPTNDVTDLQFSAANKLEAIGYTDDRPRIAWQDPMLAELQGGFDRALPGRQNRMIGRSDDNTVVLLQSSTPQDRGDYYIFIGATGRLKPLIRTGGKLDPALMSPMTAVRYSARDGLSIPAYLTLPAGREAKQLPLVVVPHGGPYGVRDTLRWDTLVQFLANRGFAVLQPNYRGSDSYGLDFHNRGQGEWGRKMQDDLDDGMDWLVGQGIVDAKRVCMVGGSYGGYAAAWGATRNPERYRCAACFAGVFDLRAQLAYDRDFFSSEVYKEYRSTVKGAGSFDLDGVSPLRQIARLKAPLLLVHGDEDNTVPVSQTKIYAAAVRHAGGSVDLTIVPKEGHGFREKGTMALWLGKLDAFLDKHNPGLA